MSLGGINNRELFGASEKPRFARDKIRQMGGIMASSSDLMEAVQQSNPTPAPAPTAPSMGAGPMTTPIQPSLPTQVPPPAPVAPAPPPVAPVTAPGQPVNVALAGNNPTSAALNAQAARRPMQMKEGGDVDVSKTPVVPKTGGVLLASLAATPGLSMIVPGLVKKYGSEEKAEEELTKKKAALDASVSSGNTENIANTLLDVSDLPINDENKKEFVSNVLGPDKVTDDIDKLNDMMAGIAVQGAGTSGATKEYIQALLYGLNLKRNTAVARAAAKAGGKDGMSPLEPFADAVRDLAGKIIQQGEDPAVAMRKAAEQLAPFYQGNVSVPQSTPTDPRKQVEEALRVQPERREEILKQAKKDGVNTEGL
tara:strand:+ start:2161 stop:3261 length:1101 start_codon:yes stop_codon:yes gene_type:complete